MANNNANQNSQANAQQPQNAGTVNNPQIEPALELALRDANNRAVAYKGSLQSGATAFQSLSGRPRRRDLDAIAFKVGDKFTIPADAASPRWISSPLSDGGDNVFRCLVHVTNATTGEEGEKEVFYGTLFKSVRDIKGKTHKAQLLVLAQDGTRSTFDTSTAIEEQEVWKLLFGKTIEVIAESDTINYVRRGFNGQPDRETTTTVLTFSVA